MYPVCGPVKKTLLKDLAEPVLREVHCAEAMVLHIMNARPMYNILFIYLTIAVQSCSSPAGIAQDKKNVLWHLSGFS
jgi:hypothetical protein